MRGKKKKINKAKAFFLKEEKNPVLKTKLVVAVAIFEQTICLC